MDQYRAHSNVKPPRPARLLTFSSYIVVIAERVRRRLPHDAQSFLWLAYVLAIAPWLHRLAGPVHEWNRLRVRRARRRDWEDRIAALKTRIGSCNPRHGAYRIRLADLLPELDEICSNLRQCNDEITLADVDQDGFLCSRFGPLWPAPVIDAEAFVPRSRFGLTVVDRGGYVGVRKDFRGNRAAFVNELEASLDLSAAGCHVPSVMAVDFERPSITFAYVHGEVVREALAQAGARIRDRDVAPIRSWFAQRRQDKQRVLCARPFVDAALDRAAAARIGKALIAIHRSGYALGDVKYGNIIIEATSRTPYFIDCEEALPLAAFSRATAAHLRDRDAHKLNALFGTSLDTAKKFRSIRKVPGGHVYSPFYVGFGLWWGAIWLRDVGMQRWTHTLAQHLPVPRGGRVLDLGANNGYNAIQMLRAGAAEVIGIEINDSAIEQGLFLKGVFEWADNREYRFSYIHGSFAEFNLTALGRFELVTALCSLYYLNRELMAKTVRALAKITDTLVLQCNEDRSIARHDPETYEKASHPYAMDLLRSNGFPHVEMIGRKGCHLPLLIARRQPIAKSHQSGP